MANYKTGPTRDWTDLMNLLVMALVEKGEEDPHLPGEFTHVFKGSVESKAGELGSDAKSVATRLIKIGWLEHQGTEKKFQGRAIWWVRNELITKEDASRADTLVRRERRGEKRKRTSKAALPYAGTVNDPGLQGNDIPKPRYEVKQDELHPGNQVVEKPNGLGEYARMNREIVALEEQLARAEAARDDWKDEAEKLQEKLDRTNAPQIEADLARSRLMVRQLLEGGEAAEMLHEAARIASL